jgi:hypothetical protein
MDWIYLLWDRYTFLAAVNTPMDLQIKKKKKKPGTISLSKGFYSRELVFKILSQFILLREGNLYVYFPRRIDKRAEAEGDNTVV